VSPSGFYAWQARPVSVRTTRDQQWRVQVRVLVVFHTDADEAEECATRGPTVLICDRDRKWSSAVRHQFQDAGIRRGLIPERVPNANAHAERFVRSIKEECLDRLIPLGERHFRGAVAEYVRALS
jgi:transposase InsO family protein